MSTVVDDKVARRPRAPARESRERVLAAAGLAFCRSGYDQAGVREIAQAAGVDPAMVIRLFGSKEALFTLVAETAFSLEPTLSGPLDRFAEAMAAHLTQPMPAPETLSEFDEFQFLLRSATSAVAAPILSASLHAHLIGPLARRIGGHRAEARAALVVACILGFATLRFALRSPPLEGERDFIRRKLATAIQGCLDG